jgi:glycosyltransferase involved in cell wall biosynthesis
MEQEISVIIPVYNGRKYLREAIASVLQQEQAALEILIVDDGSSDQSAAVAAEFGTSVRVISQEHRGAGSARNNGVRNSAGELLAFLDCDDHWAPAKLARQVACFRSQPSLDIVFTHIVNFLSPDLTAEERSHVLCPVEPLPGVSATTMLIRRASFERIGPFPEDVAVGELVPLLARAHDLGLEIEMLPEVLAYRRLHTSNLGRLKKANRIDYVRMLKQVLQQRSGAGQSAV